MSKMGDLYIEILEMLEDGVPDEEICKTLRIPQAWVDGPD